MADKAVTNVDDAWKRFSAATVGDMPEGGVTQMYKDWAKTFDEDSKLIDISDGVKRIAVEMAGLCGGNKSAYILDLCAGTGLVGEEMAKLGFTKLDALDGSKEMLDIAREKNIFKNLIVHLLGKERIPVDDHTYDGIVCSDGLYPGHVEDGTCFPELVRIVKPGGVMTFLMEPPHLPRYEADFKRLEAAGKWKYDTKQTEYTSKEGGIPGLIVRVRRL